MNETNYYHYSLDNYYHDRCVNKERGCGLDTIIEATTTAEAHNRAAMLGFSRGDADPISDDDPLSFARSKCRGFSSEPAVAGIPLKAVSRGGSGECRVIYVHPLGKPFYGWHCKRSSEIIRGAEAVSDWVDLPAKTNVHKHENTAVWANFPTIRMSQPSPADPAWVSAQWDHRVVELREERRVRQAAYWQDVPRYGDEEILQLLQQYATHNVGRSGQLVAEYDSEGFISSPPPPPVNPTPLIP